MLLLTCSSVCFVKHQIYYALCIFCLCSRCAFKTYWVAYIEFHTAIQVNWVLKSISIAKMAWQQTPTGYYPEQPGLLMFVFMHYQYIYIFFCFVKCFCYWCIIFFVCLNLFSIDSFCYLLNAWLLSSLLYCAYFIFSFSFSPFLKFSFI